MITLNDIIKVFKEEILLKGFELEVLLNDDNRIEFKWTENRIYGYNQIVVYVYKFQKHFDLEAVKGFINFNDIEEPLRPILEKFKIPNRVCFTIQQTNDEIEMDYYSGLLNYSINDEESLTRSAIGIKNFVETNRLPFFHNYQSLKDFYLGTIGKTIQQLSDFINQPITYRLMLIKKHFNLEEYLEYKNKLISYYSQENNNREVEIIEAIDESIVKLEKNYLIVDKGEKIKSISDLNWQELKRILDALQTASGYNYGVNKLKEIVEKLNDSDLIIQKDSTPYRITSQDELQKFINTYDSTIVISNIID